MNPNQPEINPSMYFTQKPNYRQKGKAIQGKLVRGFINDPSLKVNHGSIPTQMETIIYKHNSMKAFGTSANRFKDQPDGTEDIGPGYYNLSQKSNQSTMSSTSLTSSLKSNAPPPFISRSERAVFESKYVNTGPGPGSYQAEQPVYSQSLSTRGSSVFLSNSRDSKQQQENAGQRIVVENPGPGQYNPRMLKSENTFHSAFISAVQRDQYMGKSTAPPPGEYNIQRSLIKKLNYQHKGNMASFSLPKPPPPKQVHKQEVMKFLQQKNAKLNLNQPESKIPQFDQPLPGPGEYQDKIPEFQPQYEKLNGSSNFQDSIKDRFGDLTQVQSEKPPILGPGTYNTEKYGFDQLSEKAPLSGMPFMSYSIRKPYGQFDQQIGPSLSVPYLPPQKQSFQLNLARKWVGV